MPLAVIAPMLVWSYAYIYLNVNFAQSTRDAWKWMLRFNYKRIAFKVITSSSSAGFQEKHNNTTQIWRIMLHVLQIIICDRFGVFEFALKCYWTRIINSWYNFCLLRSVSLRREDTMSWQRGSINNLINGAAQKVSSCLYNVQYIQLNSVYAMLYTVSNQLGHAVL